MQTNHIPKSGRIVFYFGKNETTEIITDDVELSLSLITTKDYISKETYGGQRIIHTKNALWYDVIYD